jgi:hypothetical protein
MISVNKSIYPSSIRNKKVISMQFEYTVLKKKVDIYGVKYFLDERDHLPKFNDISFIRVLNILGDQGWELAVKESQNTYILKRQVTS